MPVTNYPWVEYTWDGVDGYLWDGKLFVEKGYNPETGVAVAFFAPPGGRSRIPAMSQGDPGLPITIRNVVTTELANNSSTPMSMSFTLVTPGSATVQPVYDVAVALRVGKDGASSTFAFLTATDLVGSALTGYSPTYVADTGLAVGAQASGKAGVVWTPPKVGGAFWPANIVSTTSADGAQRTLAYVQVPTYAFDVRLEPMAGAILVGTGAGDCVADLIVRVGNPTSGDIIARKAGLALTAPRDMTLLPGPAGGGASTVSKIAANSGLTTVTLRAERQSGADSFSTSGFQTTYCVKAVPLP